MMKLIVKRIASDDTGTSGVLLFDGFPRLVTLERPWLNNSRHVSCIPKGCYKAFKIHSPRFGETFHIHDVPGRSEILFHQGNDIEDTSGCILVGTRFGLMPDRLSIIDSMVGMNRFRMLLEKEKEVVVEIME